MGIRPNVLTAGFRYLLLSIVAAVVLFPLLWILFTAVEPLREVFAVPPHLLPRSVDLGNFLRAWSAEPFSTYLRNSLLVSLAIIAGQIVTSAMAAYALVRVPFPLRRLSFWLIMTSLMIPVQVTFIPVFLLLRDWNWIDTYQALIVPFVGSGFGTFWLVQTFRQLPPDVLDAAALDGAGHLRILWSVVMPMARGGVITLGVLNFVWHYNDFFWPLIVTQSTDMRTMPLGLATLVATDGNVTPWNLLMAASILTMLPNLILYAIGQRYLLAGLMHTGIRE